MYATFDNVRNALHLAWRYKILWVFALLVAAGSFSGFGGGNSGGFDSKAKESSPSQTKTPLNTFPKTIGDTQISAVLGTAVSDLTAKSPRLDNLFIAEYIPHIIVVILALLVSITTAVVVAFSVKSWATGSFIYGTDIAFKNGEISLKDLSERGVASVWRLIKFQVLVFLLFLGLIFVLFSLPFITYAVTRSWSSGGTIIALTLSILAFVLTAISLSYSTLYSIRHLVLNGSTASDSVMLGLKTFYANIGNSIKLSLANCLVQSFIGLAGIMVLLLVAGITAGIFSGNQSEAIQLTFGLLTAILGVPLIIAIILAVVALGGYMTTYQNITWTTLFNYIEGKADENEQ